jgi:hypothetical protein
MATNAHGNGCGSPSWQWRLTRTAMVAAMTTNTRLTHTAIHHGDHLSAQGSLHGGYRHGRRRKLIAKAKSKHRYLLPKGVPKLSERNSADHAAIVSAMNAGRISKQREQHMYNRETKLSKRELEAQRTILAFALLRWGTRGKACPNFSFLIMMHALRPPLELWNATRLSI